MTRHILHNCKKYIGEWLLYSLIFFFLYDIIWWLADLPDFIDSLKGNYFWLFLDFIYCSIFSFASIYINKHLFNTERLQHGKHGHRYFVSNGLVILAFYLLISLLGESFASIAFPSYLTDDFWGSAFLFGLIASLVAFINLSRHYSETMIKNAQENLALQKKYLLLQLDPHFVFNSLSSLTGMIEEAPKMAEEYVVQLSHIYRYMLRHIDKEYSSIQEAEEFARLYVGLLNMRYDNNIILQTDKLNDCKGDRILSLSLQLLIENAVKHNSPQEGCKLHLQLSRKGNMLVLKNNRIYSHSPNGQDIESYGIGISNLQKRYRLECEQQPEFIATPDSFEVRLPIIKRQQ